MRAVVVMTLAIGLAGCFDLGTTSDDDGTWEHPSDPGGGNSHGCRTDDACPGGQLCSRAGGCLPSEQIYAVHVTWTLSGEPANKTTCDATPDLQIGFYTRDDISIGYAPVPCSQGKFTVDKLPRTYVDVRLGKSSRDEDSRTANIDAVTGDAMLDLPF